MYLFVSTSYCNLFPYKTTIKFYIHASNNLRRRSSYSWNFLHNRPLDFIRHSVFPTCVSLRSFHRRKVPIDFCKRFSLQPHLICVVHNLLSWFTLPLKNRPFFFVYLCCVHTYLWLETAYINIFFAVSLTNVFVLFHLPSVVFCLFFT